MAVITITNVTTMAGRIKQMERLFDRLRRPYHRKSLIKTALHILCEAVTSTALSTLRFHEGSQFVEIISKRHHRESVCVADVTVCDEGCPDFEASVAVLNIRQNLCESVLGSLNPAAHRTCAVE